MSLQRNNTLERYYEAIERSLPLAYGDNGLAESVRFIRNRNEAVHNWFHFKEGFSSRLLSDINLDLGCMSRADSVFVDPFCGSGTTILAGDLQHNWRGKRIGIEINPFLRFVANTKSRWREYDPSIFLNCAEHILAQKLQTDIPSSNWPQLTTLHNREIFEPYRVSALIDAVARVTCLPCPERDLLLLGIASAIERVGYYRKDGRALRILRNEDEIAPRRHLIIEELLESIWTSYAVDLIALSPLRSRAIGDAHVIQDNGPTLAVLPSFGIDEGMVDFFAYSPPYLNHIDYTEVYKVELWLLGHVVSQAQMLALRKQTLRSHASYTFHADTNNLPSELTAIVDILADEIEATGKNWHRHFRNTALGYLQDMRTAFLKQFVYLKDNGYSVFVVANSAHGSGSHRVPVATDLLLARLAESVGFQVVKVLVARRTQRRDAPNPYLRESIITLKKA